MPFSVTYSHTIVSRKYVPPFAILALVQNAGGGAYLRDTMVLRHIFVPNKTPFVKAMSFSVRSCVYTQNHKGSGVSLFFCVCVFAEVKMVSKARVI